MSTESNQCRCTLRLVRDYDGEFLAPSLRRPHNADCCFSITTHGPKHEVKVFPGVGIVDEFFEVRHPVRKYLIDENDETARELLLVRIDEALAVVAGGVLSVVERGLVGNI